LPQEIRNTDGAKVYFDTLTSSGVNHECDGQRDGKRDIGTLGQPLRFTIAITALHHAARRAITYKNSAIYWHGRAILRMPFFAVECRVPLLVFSVVHQ